MDDAGAQLPPDARKIANVMEQGIDEGPGAGPGRWVHDESRRLVEREEVLVLVEHGEGNRLGLEGDGAGLRYLDLDFLARANLVRPLSRDSGHARRAFLDQPLDPGPRQVRANGREKQIEPRPLGGLADFEATNH